jgi:spore maturation protein CgeB
LLDQKINLTVTTGDYLPIYQRSRIVINQSVNDDLNLRFFEAAGCGALLISERLSHSNTCILTPEEDYLLYEKDNSEDLILKIKWVQSNIKEAEEMAERAYFKIHNNHLIHHRCQTILDKAASTKAAHPRSIASISHLAFAYMINSQLALPDYICTEYVAMAKKKALEILSTDKTNPWATAVLLC